MPSKAELTIAGYYDGIFRFYGTVNRLLTLGLDVWWRRRAAKTLKELRPGAETALDVCAGTGDFSIILCRTYGGTLKVTGADLSSTMLSAARQKTAEIKFVEAEAKNLPFADASFDLVAISFAARNLNTNRESMIEALRESRRVLKAGGAFMNLETTRPKNPAAGLIFRLYVRTAIGVLNLLRPESRAQYSFLRTTILNFYHPEEFTALLLEAGFKTAGYKILCPGAVAVHLAVK